MIASIQTPWPGCDVNATGPSLRNDSSVEPDVRTGTPPHELITNSRCTPSTSDQTAGLFESISRGQIEAGRGDEPRASACAALARPIVATATIAMTRRAARSRPYLRCSTSGASTSYAVMSGCNGVTEIYPSLTAS